MSHLEFCHNFIFIKVWVLLQLSFDEFEFCHNWILSQLKFCHTLFWFGLVSIEFCLKESLVTIWGLFQFVLSQFEFVTIWVCYNLSFVPIIVWSHFKFSRYCKIGTLLFFYLSLVTILVVTSKRYFSLLLYLSQKTNLYTRVFKVTNFF